MMTEEWPNDVTERLQGYAERNNISLDEATEKFTKWLKAEFEVDNALSEDEFYLKQWSEQFVIERRNESLGNQRETVTWVGMFVGIEDAPRDDRKSTYDRAVQAFRNNRERAIEQNLIGVLTAKEGRWHINGKPSDERVNGSDLPWFGFEYDDAILCLLNNRNGEFKPMAPTSLSRKAYFMGSAEKGGDIQLWSISLQGKAMEANYTKWEACTIQVIAPTREGQDILYTNRNFHETVDYTDAWLPEHLRQAFSAERLLVNPKMHGEYVELSDLIEAHADRSFVTKSGATVNPIVITSGYITYLNREAMSSDYDPTGRTYRLNVYRQGVEPVTAWVSGTMHDNDRVFEYRDRNGDWRFYNERTQVIIVGRLRLKPYNNEMRPSMTALGVYIPPRTARPDGGSGETSLKQFGGN